MLPLAPHGDHSKPHVERLYTAIQLPGSWAERLREELDAEVIARQGANTAQRELLTHRVAKAEAQRRKLPDAYYSGAIDVPTLKVEQARIGADLATAQDRLADLDANLTSGRRSWSSPPASPPAAATPTARPPTGPVRSSTPRYSNGST